MKLSRQRTLTLVTKNRFFYVDATLGDNNKSGRSSSLAWQTISKVNGFSFQSGDRILFKRGETWTGTCLIVPRGSLYFGAYGTGAKPILDANNVVNGIQCVSRDYVTFENLDVRNGLDFCFSVASCNHLSIINCDTQHAGNDNVLLEGTFISVIGGLHKTPYSRLADGRLVTCIEIDDGGSDYMISGVECQESAFAGISIHCHNGREMPRNVTVTNSLFHNNTGPGINMGIAEAGGLSSVLANIVIDTCQSYSNTGAGIRLMKVTTYYAQGITVRDCKCYSNIAQSIIAEADHISLVTSVFDGICSFSGCTYLSTTNCVFYNHANAGTTFNLQGSRSSNFYARNNIIMNNVAGQVIIIISAGTGVVGWDCDYNLYRRTGGLVTNTHWNWLGTSYNFADWKTQTAKDANSPTPANPLFTDAANHDFTLQAGSPAINAGVDIGLPFLGVAPDCGAFEKQ